MILNCSHLKKAYGGNEVLKDISFSLEKGERAALIGNNGAGKTTLLRILTGIEKADGGRFAYFGDCRTGILEQHADISGSLSIADEVRRARADIIALEDAIRQMERDISSADPEQRSILLERYDALTAEYELRDGYASDSEITGVLRGLGFSDAEIEMPLSNLSGGQKTRVVLARLLLDSPDILFLDEPTNHLDVESMSWLEDRLQKYPGTILLVSHDRYFMDRLVNKVIGIENGVSTVYSGNYSEFGRKQAEARKAAMNAWKKQQAEIKHQKEVITRLRQFNREKSIKRAESREKLLEKTELLEKPAAVQADMRLSLDPAVVSGTEVCSVELLSKAFQGPPLFSDLSFNVERGERAALIGGNGTGKSTILKIMNGILEPDAGSVSFGHNVTVGYYDQEQQLLHDEKTLFEELHDSFPGRTDNAIRNTLAAFLFLGDDVFKKVSVLSGGERARLCLARLMLSGANFLILDEPTNHLDITSREILEDALTGYSGTVLCVSHDRYFINRIATRVLALSGGMLTSFDGNYDRYLEKRQEGPAGESDQTAVSAARADWEEQKKQLADQRKKQNRVKAVEERIAALEDRLKETDEILSLPETGTDLQLCQDLAAEQAGIRDELSVLYDQWEQLSDDL